MLCDQCPPRTERWALVLVRAVPGDRGYHCLILQAHQGGKYRQHSKRRFQKISGLHQEPGISVYTMYSFALINVPVAICQAGGHKGKVTVQGAGAARELPVCDWPSAARQPSGLRLSYMVSLRQLVSRFPSSLGRPSFADPVQSVPFCHVEPASSTWTVHIGCCAVAVSAVCWTEPLKLC